MKRIFYSTIVLIGSAIAFSACNKNEDSNDQPKYATVRAAMETVAPKPVTFNVDAATGGNFLIGKSRLIIPPGAFKTTFGTAVAGIVNVEVLEVLTKSDMTFSRILPVSNGDQLVSAGEFWVRAKQNGSQLLLQNGTPIEIRVPQFGMTAAGMQFFTGVQTNDSAANIVNWLGKGQGGLDSTRIGRVAISGDTVSIFTDSIGLCNADRFLNKPNYKIFTVTVVAPNGITLTAKDVAGYTLYDSYRAVWPLHTFVNSQFSEDHVPDIPVHFVVFAVVNGNFYGGITSGVPADNGNYIINLAATTPTQFKGLVDAL